MRNIIKPARLNGEIFIPPSKSMTHRAVICAGFAKGISMIDNVDLCDDVTATIDGVKELGAEIKIINSKKYKNRKLLHIKNTGIKKEKINIDCVESGSTLRFMIPAACIFKGTKLFTGSGRLPKRPVDEYFKIFKVNDIHYSTPGHENLPLEVNGVIHNGNYNLPGEVSSQYISGLLMALPLCEGDSVIKITSCLQSRAYVDMTIDVMKKFGVDIIEREKYREYFIKGKQEYKPADYNIEGDWSSASCFIAAGAAGCKISIKGLSKESRQPDKALLDILSKDDYKFENESLVINGNNIKNFCIDVSQCPDAVPALSVIAAAAEGKSRILNAKRLRIKESDRLNAVSMEFKKLGVKIEEKEDSLLINGKGFITGGQAESRNDHRIAMALSMLSIIAENDIIIDGSECVSKSYPDFWDDFKRLGGRLV